MKLDAPGSTKTLSPEKERRQNWELLLALALLVGFPLVMLIFG